MKKIRGISDKSGFTLIELMLVISIISLLSSIVLTSLSTARNKAKDSVVIQQLLEFQKLLELEWNTNKTYAALQPNVAWITTSGGCDTYYGGSAYVTEARNVCKKIVANLGTGTAGFYTGVNAAGGLLPTTKYYSVMAGLNTQTSGGSNVYACVGSSGKTLYVTNTAWTAWTDLGCYGNP